MPTSRRLHITISSQLADRLERETDNRVPKLPKRYVIELALKRLFEDLDQGQFELELAKDARV